MAGKFDNIDLGTDKAMRRIVEAEHRKRMAIIEECMNTVMPISAEAGCALLKLMQEKPDA